MMGFRGSWLVAVLLAVLAGVNAQVRPNIVFILVDDLGYSDLSIQGSKQVKTPNIDFLGKKGAQFTDVYAQAGFCSPSRAGILAGQHPGRFGHVFNPVSNPEDNTVGMPLNLTTIPDTLKKAGYTSGVFGKWHLGYAEEHFPLNRGFDRFWGFLGGEHSYFEATHILPGGTEPESVFDDYDNPDSIKYMTTQITLEAMRFIEDSHRQGKPSFSFISYNAAHSPFEFRPPDVDPNIPPHRQPLVAMIKNLDDNVGRLLRHLRSLNILRNTLIIWTNDNGGQKKNADNRPLRSHKGFWWEGGVRVPFFAYWKNTIKPGQVINHPISLVDLYPTFQAAAMVPFNHRNTKLEGANLLRYVTLQGATAPQNRGAPHPHIAISLRGSGIVRLRKWKLIVIRGEPRQLFDLEVDISETTNLLERYPNRVRAMFKLFKQNVKKDSPYYAFPIDAVPTPIKLTLTAPNRVRRNQEVVFVSTSGHTEGGRLQYHWEVYRPFFRSRADYKTLVSPDVDIRLRRGKRRARITFKKPGRWAVRVNTFDGRFRKWKEVIVTVP